MDTNLKPSPIGRSPAPLVRALGSRTGRKKSANIEELLVIVLFVSVIFITGVYAWQQLNKVDRLQEIVKIGWQTYTDKNFGISIKYPPNWTIEEDTSVDDYISRRIFLNGKNDVSLWINKVDTLDIVISPIQRKDIIINNIAAIVQDESGYYGITSVYFPKDNYFIRLQWINDKTHYGDGGELDNIINSFRFTDQTADWQTYIDSDLGYQVSYPKDWQVASNPYPGCEITGCDTFSTKGVSITMGREYKKWDGSKPGRSFDDFYNNKFVGWHGNRIFFTTEPTGIPYKMFREEYDFSQYSIAKDDLESYWSPVTQFIYKDGYIYYLELNLLQNTDLQSSLDIFDKVLATFKFTDQTAGLKTLLIDEQLVRIKYPDKYILKKNTELNRRGSLIAYDIISQSGMPDLQEIELFTEASIKQFNDKCAKLDYPCFFGDYPTVERFKGLTSAFDGNKSYSDYKFQKIGGEKYLVKNMRSVGDSGMIREYNTFVGEDMVTIWFSIKDNSSSAAADALMASWQVEYAGF